MKIFCFLISLCSALHATPSLSRFGIPKYDIKKPFPYVSPNAPKGGKLSLGTLGTFTTLNPFTVTGIAPSLDYLINSVYAPLMMRSTGEAFSLYPWIANSIEVAKDHSFIKIYIRKSAKFHDGSPILASDISTTIDVFLKEGLPKYRSIYKKILEKRILSSWCVQIFFKKTENGTYDSELPLWFGMLTPLPEKVLKTMPLNELSLIPGSGPYKIEKSIVGHTFTLKRLKNHWTKELPLAKGCYNFDFIQFDYYQNPHALFQAFLAGLSHMYFETDPMHWKNAYPTNCPKIEKITLAHHRPVLVRTILMNMKRSLFQSMELRKALVLAFDFQTLNRLVFGGEYKCPKSLFENTPFAHPSVASKFEKESILKALRQNQRQLTQEIENSFATSFLEETIPHRQRLLMAQALLKKGGFRVKNGILYTSNQMPVCFEFLIKEPRFEKIALLFRKSLKRLGINLTIRLVDSCQYEERVASRRFDFIVHAWANTLSPGIEQAYYFSTEMADVKGSSNYIGIKDFVAETLAKGIQTAKSEEELKDKVHAFDRYVMFQYWQIPLLCCTKEFWAFWRDKVAFPPLSKTHRIDIMSMGWDQKIKS